jgi:hypothetical protein
LKGVSKLYDVSLVVVIVAAAAAEAVDVIVDVAQNELGGHRVVSVLGRAVEIWI